MIKQPTPVTVQDPATDRALREHQRAIVDLIGLPMAGAKVLRDVELLDGVETPIAHGQQRVPIWVQVSCPRNQTSSGRIVEIRSSDYDRTQYVVLKASGCGSSIIVDVLVA